MFIVKPTSPQWAGLALVWLGGIAATRWVFGLDFLANAIPGFAEMGIVAPVLFGCAGTSLWLLGRPESARHSSLQATAVVSFCVAVLLVFPGLMLIEHLSGATLGVDIVRQGIRPSPTSPFPGRMSPNACVGFFLAALALILQLEWRNAAPKRLSLIFLLGTGAIGAAGCAGYFLRSEVLYTLTSANRLTLPVAYGLVCLAAGLWLLLEQRSVERTLEGHESRITKRSVAVVALVAVAAGVAGFATVEKSFEEVQARTLVATATTDARSLANALDVGLWFTRTVATRPAVTQTLTRLAQAPGDAAALDLLAKAADSLLTAGISSVRFEDQKGRTLAISGTVLPEDYGARFALIGHGDARLLWKRGYILHVEEPVLSEGRRIGQVVSQQRLPLFDQLLDEIRQENPSSDALICSRESDAAAFCGPSRVRPTPFTLPLTDANGQPNYAVLGALNGKAGSALIKDLRGVQVLAAMAPIGTFGVGLIVKTNVADLYAPLRERLHLLALLLVILVAAGTFAFRSLVKPLVKQVVDEQRRTRVILENSNDAFIGLDADGLITDWNGEAERTFGWKTEEAVGRELAALIIPEELRSAHDTGMAKFRSTGHGPIVNRRINVAALHKDGHRFTAELSVAAFLGKDGYVAHAFVRDITERLDAQQRLTTSEQRLQAITDNLPVLISYIDKHHTVTFANKTLTEWTGQDSVSVVGRSMKEVLGADLYGQRVAHLGRALSGQRVEFEWVSDGVNATRDVHTVYVPDILVDGSIAGVYSLSSDVTSSKLAQKHLDQLARMDPLTRLPNRREFEDRLDKAMARSRRSKRPMALVFLDVDKFKDINDAHGHGVGDAVLKEFASRLDHSIRVTDTAARLAGDEFVVILEGLHSAVEVAEVSEKLGEAIRTPMRVSDLTLLVTASIGTAFFEGMGGTADELVARADRALYRAKAAGRDTFAATTF